MKMNTCATTMNALTVAIAATLAVVISTPASAEGFYAGGGIGYASGTFNNSDFSPSAVQDSVNAELVSSGFPGTAAIGGSADESDFAWKVYGGYRFNEYFGVEGGYANFGKFKYNYTGSYLGAGGNVNVKYKVDSWNLAGVARYPLANGFSVQGKLGAAFTKAKNDVSIDFANLSDSSSAKKSKTNLLWGVGAGYEINQRLGLLLEYENYGEVGNEADTGRMKVDLWSASVLYKF